MESSFFKKLQRVFVSVSLIWIINLFVGVLILAVAWFVGSRVDEPIIKGIAPPVVGQIKNVLIGLGIFEVLIGLFIKKRIMAQLDRLSIEDEDSFILKFSKIYSSAHLVPASIALSISLYGLLLIFAGAEKNSTIPLFIISYIGLWLFQPRIKELRAIASKGVK